MIRVIERFPEVWMRLAYTNEDGLQLFVELADQPVMIGRSPEADIVLGDGKVSRLHCGIRKDAEGVWVKDLGSRNGTFVNTVRIESPTLLQPGDHLRVGDTLLTIEERLMKGNATILHEIEAEMDHGKGYKTILHEIVETDNEEKD